MLLKWPFNPTSVSILNNAVTIREPITEEINFMIQTPGVNYLLKIYRLGIGLKAQTSSETFEKNFETWRLSLKLMVDYQIVIAASFVRIFKSQLDDIDLDRKTNSNWEATNSPKVFFS